MVPLDRQVRPDQPVPPAPQVPLAQRELQDRPGLQVRPEQLAQPARPEQGHQLLGDLLGDRQGAVPLHPQRHRFDCPTSDRTH